MLLLCCLRGWKGVSVHTKIWTPWPLCLKWIGLCPATIEMRFVPTLHHGQASAFFCGGHFIGWDGVSLPSIIEFTLDPRISFAKVTCHLKSFVRGMMSQGPCRRTNASRPWPVWRFEGGWECLPQTGVHSSGPGFPTRRRISRRFIARRVVLVVELLVADAAWLPGRCFFFFLCVHCLNWLNSGMPTGIWCHYLGLDHNVKVQKRSFWMGPCPVMRDGGILVCGPPCSLWIFMSAGTHKRHHERYGIWGNVALKSVRMANAITKKIVNWKDFQNVCICASFFAGNLGSRFV